MFKNKHQGYNMDLYRSDRNRWIAGVCGGIAENMNWPVWLVRLGAFALFIVTGSFVILAYILAIFLLDRRDKVIEDYERTARSHGHGGHAHSARRHHSGMKETVFNYQKTPGSQVKDLASRLKDLDGRLQSMETYVTSRKFQIDQELKRS